MRIETSPITIKLGANLNEIIWILIANTKA